MNYTFYRSYSQHFHATFKKAGAPLKDDYDLLANTVKVMPNYTNTMEFPLFTADHLWLKQDPVILFPESAQLLHNISRAKKNVSPEDFDLTAIPKRCAVAMPKELGPSHPPFLMTVMTNLQWRNDMTEFLHAATGIKGTVRTVNWNADIMKDDDLRIGLNWWKTYPAESETAWMCMCSYIPAYWINDLVNQESPEEVADIIGMLDDSHPLTDEDLEQQCNVIHTAINLLVYISALPERLVDGMPNEACKARHLKHMTPRKAKPGRPVTLSAPKRETKSPKEHYRTWFFRRYPKRNGKRKSGIVFVRDTIVKGRASKIELQPKTVIEK